nr:chitobiase/beta-hexosaminidase C-terminal domain-containing protein [Prolixibacteraceae bacterium]
MAKIICTLFLLVLFLSSHAQIVINEASNRNLSQIMDEDGDFNDWIELHNTQSTDVDLNGWALSDSRKNPSKWLFGSGIIPARGYRVIHASDKNRRVQGEAIHWESVVLPTSLFSYTLPDASTPANWYQPGFNDASWKKGQAGFGYGDNDDRTIVPSTSPVVFIRIRFTLPDVSALSGMLFHADYDDGFVAYLNGTVIARANINENPQWNTLANENHEAVMYNGGTPESFEPDWVQVQNLLRNGENVLAIRVHNVSTTSSDLSMIPFLSFAIKEGQSYFQPVPDWFLGKTSAQLHSNFKLSAQGERIFLSYNGVIVDSMYVPELFADQSFGRKTDGSAEYGIFTSATPATSNNVSTAWAPEYTSPPSFDLEAGFYFSDKEVGITCNEPGAVIRYTTDGSEPHAGSPRYTGPITIRKTTCLKARCFTNQKLPGKTTAATYFRDVEYTLPVLSVSANPADIFGESGIFTHYNQTWDIPAYAEYFDKTEKRVFNLNAGMQVDGGAGGSRSLPQHSFRIEPGNRVFGDGDLSYKLMPRRPNRTNYPSFYVRNGSNQHLVLPYKDGLQVTALGQNTYTYYSAYHPIVVFINGEYYGVYELREKINDDFLVDNY